MRASISAIRRLLASFDQFGHVVVMRRAQHQPLGDQHRAIYRQTFVFEVFLFGNHGYPPEHEKGEMATHLP